MTEEALGEDKIEERLEDLEIWGEMSGKLATRVEFNEYKEAVFFANSVYSLAERMNHHPKVTVEHGAVNIDVYTHEADGLTEKDYEFASEVEEILGDMEWS